MPRIRPDEFLAASGLFLLGLREAFEGTARDCASVAMHHKRDVIALGCLGLYRHADCLDVIFELLMQIGVDGGQLYANAFVVLGFRGWNDSGPALQSMLRAMHEIVVCKLGNGAETWKACVKG
jgi:hypothetical protein